MSPSSTQALLSPSVDSIVESMIVHWLGRISFQDALTKQINAREALVEGLGDEQVFLCEHDPVLTLGRRAKACDILWNSDDLERKGIQICETPRGGEVTLHAPGQLVVYPVVRTGTKVRQHVQSLANATIATLQQHGLRDGFYRSDHPGVWLSPNQKIASIGVHISRGVAIQGLSLNIDVERDYFGSLVSCGLPGIQMVNFRDFVGGSSPSLIELGHEWIAQYAAKVNRDVRWVETSVDL